MAQHDYNLANQSGADFRTDLNNALSAIASNNSGASAPSTTFAYEWWVDTGTGVLKLRNSANSAWITMPFSISSDNTVDINGGTVNGISSLSFSSGATVASILDEDNLSSDSATALATQQSIKAYVDSQVTAQDLDITDGSSTIAIDLDSETLSLLGGTGITATASGNGVTFAIGQSVATSDNVVFNQVTGALVGNASTATALATARTIGGTSFDGTANIAVNLSATATALATARTISGVSFDGTANITLDTDDIGEGSNKYFTVERVDDQVNTLLTAGTGITLTYNDGAGTLTIDGQTGDIESVVAGDGLTGGGTSGDVTLTVGVDDSSIEINSDALRVKASGITNAMLGGSIANAKLSNSSVTINSQAIALGGSHTFDTDDIGEGSSNIYFTDARANSAIDARVTNTFINNLSGVVADTSTALATARTIALSGDVTASGVSFDGTANITLSTTIAANSVALGTDTTGNYIQTITGTNNKISVSGSGSESADVTLTLPSDVQIANDLTVAGDLTVNGDLTYLDTTNLKIEDNLFELNANLTGSPVNDSGMLINRGNQNNGIFMWDESADKFTIGLTTADGTSTGNITLASLGTLVANLEGNVTGDVTGNVSGTAATVTGAAQTAITSVGTLTGLTTTGDINLGDNDKVIFGADSDLQIYHDASNSYIDDAGTGGLSIRSNLLQIGKYTGELSAQFVADGESNLYYDNSKKIATTSTGIDVTGVITTDGLTTSADINFGDNDKAVFGAGSDLQIYHDGSHSYIKEASTGNLILNANNFRIEDNSTNPYLFATAGAEVTIYHNGNPKLATTSTGIAVTGNIANTSGDLTLDVAGDIILDADGGDVILKDGGTNFAILSKAGANLDIYNAGNDGSVVFKGEDGGTGITALTLDMSNAGRANFNNDIALNDNRAVRLGSDDDAAIYNDGSNTYIKNGTSNQDIIFQGNDDGSAGTTALTLDMSDAGKATFNGTVKVNGAGNTLELNASSGVTYQKFSENGTGRFFLATLNGADGLAFVDADGSTERMRLDSGGDLLIGTTSAGSRVTIAESISTSYSTSGYAATPSNSMLYLNNTNGGSDTAALINFRAGSGDGVIGFVEGGGTNDADFVIQTDGGSNGVERLRILNDGKVGIGTNSPDHLLEIETASSSVAPKLGFRNTQAGAQIGMPANVNALAFTTGDNERMRIDSAGTIYQGTTTPTLHSAQRGIVFENGCLTNDTNRGAGKSINLAQNCAIDSGNTFAYLATDEASVYQQFNGNHYFYTAPSGSAGADVTLDTKLFVGNTGNVGISTTAPDGKLHISETSGSATTAYITNSVSTADSSTKPLLQLQFNGDASLGTGTPFIKFANQNDFIGSITGAASSVAYNTSSDYRLKENVDYTWDATTRLKQLKPARFNFIADADMTVDGFLAHEVSSIVPEAITGEKDAIDSEGNPEYQGIDQSKLVPLLVKTIQELEARITALES